MRGLLFSALTFLFLQPLSAIASKVVVQEGDTLSEIAQKHKVSLKELIRHNRINNANNLKVGQTLIIPKFNQNEKEETMIYTISQGETINEIAKRFATSAFEITKLNDIRDPDLLYEGQEIKIPTQTQKLILKDKKTHSIKAGETIGSIAALYKIKKESIIKYNQITNPDNIFPGQKLIIPTQRQKSFTENEQGDSKKLLHEVKSGDSLLTISEKHNVPLSKIIEINNIRNPNQLRIGQKIYLKSTQIAKSTQAKKEINKKNKLDWRTYGPLKIDWSNWQALGSSYVTPSINSEGKVLYLAINCSAKKINSTGSNGTWKNWIEPIEKFEHNLINDLCKDKRS